jgi:hypothetical protein
MAITDKRSTPEEINVTSLVSGRTLEPVVQIQWGEHRAQLSPEEARQHALSILSCAEAAESDAFVFQWLTRDIVGTEAERAAEFERIMREFRGFREARFKKEL